MSAWGSASLLSLAALWLCLASRAAAAAGTVCSPCQPELCMPVKCAAPELSARDECGCCERCLSAEGERCGGERGARCGPGLVCVSQRQAEPPPEAGEEGTGRCVCKEDGAVCGSDGRSYGSVCALHLHSWRALHGGRERVRKAHDGECKLAPAILVPPKRIHNVTGAQVYLSCEVKAVPTPIITWKKVTESPKGVKLLEELPGDRVNMAVQVRGGPSKHESTGWVLINPLTKEDEGVYQCHATNMVGEIQAEGHIKVLEQSKNKDTFPASEDMK
ncbi:insulin-like growth factor-binding protein-like 1 [Hemicordylus capensis]|uniref:insulin-like growth factor-binding protein-like 1 n=1 Tax=Hemicordylus capensis TaxID=884348 RepID=UPI0023037055|nr:insulin-like growth factor-binding protein-like 1 [Hemicordylus capensis]XP_053159517.1 insulin-like growth factor-binding protein-like 1 [Hemicordylus capensis]